jgi:hypothetical protein
MSTVLTRVTIRRRQILELGSLPVNHETVPMPWHTPQTVPVNIFRPETPAEPLREERRMAKGSMLSKSHSRIGKFASWDEPETAQQSNTGQRNWGNRFGGLLARSVRPSSHVRS